MTRLKFYYDLMSQPSRALYIFIKLNNIPFEPCHVNLRNGEHFADAFKHNISRFQKVPVLHDHDFKLTENIAIVCYLTREFPVADHWYPKDSKKRARVDEYLEWQHNNTRATCATFFVESYIKPKLMGKENNPKVVEYRKRDMVEVLDKIEELWLSQGHNYIAGDEISYADILGSCELEQPRMAGFDPCQGRPKMTAWMERVKKETNPYYDEAHVIVHKIIGKQVAAAKL